MPSRLPARGVEALAKLQTLLLLSFIVSPGTLAELHMTVVQATVLLVEAGDGTQPSLLDNVKTVADIFGTAVAAIALIIGGIWAYFKFAKGRTFRPRIKVDLSGKWVSIGEKRLLQIRVTVGNIGTSVVRKLERGTGMRISVPDVNQSTPPALISWRSVGVFNTLVEHEWIEPGETVSDDRLLDLGTSEPVVVQVEVRLILHRSLGSNIEVLARHILFVTATNQEAEGIPSSG